MGNSLLDIKPHKVSRDLRGYSVMFYGEPKSGKTTISSKFPGALVLAFEKGYNKEYGCTLSQLVTDKKLSTAEQLIRNGKLPIDQIAAQSGLGSVNYFYAVFKKRYGMSPLQYRKHYQQEKAQK